MFLEEQKFIFITNNGALNNRGVLADKFKFTLKNCGVSMHLMNMILQFLSVPVFLDHCLISLFVSCPIKVSIAIGIAEYLPDVIVLSF